MQNLIARTTVKRNKSLHRYHVRAYDINDKRLPDSDYFTDDKQDAIDTAEAMIEPFVHMTMQIMRQASSNALNAIEQLDHDDMFADLAPDFARNAAHRAANLLKIMSLEDILLRPDVITNDELITMYQANYGSSLLANAIRERVRFGIIKPESGKSYYDGPPDNRCGHCGLPGGH